MTQTKIYYIKNLQIHFKNPITTNNNHKLKNKNRIQK